MKINFLGDSITEGYGSSDYEHCFVSLVKNELKCEVNNYGIGGSRIAKNIIPSIGPEIDYYFGGRVKDMDRTANYVFVFGGTNDYGHGSAPLGKLGDKKPITFYGGVDYLVNELLKCYKKEQIIFILPLYRLDENNPYGEGFRVEPTKPLQAYRDAIVEVLKKYEIEYLDIKDKLKKAEESDCYLDGLHPNDKGHRLIANEIIQRVR